MAHTMPTRKQIPQKTKLHLFSASAGHCQRPQCLKVLFPEEIGGDIHIAEMAHVIPHGDSGPRHKERTNDDFEVDAFDNLILLCPTCHKIIDKAPKLYPRETLLEWKRNHLVELAVSQGIIFYQSRSQARAAITSAMDENRAIWRQYAPVDGSQFIYDPESESVQKWSQRMISVIIPNHFRIQSIIKMNSSHLTEKEKEIFAEYNEHVRGLAERHLCGTSGAAIRYPQDMNGVFS